jgi:hypothetical protein
MTYRVYVYWIDEPEGRIWQVDDGDQGESGERAEIYREVRFVGVDARTVSRREPNAELMGRREPKCWLEVTNAVPEVAGDVITFHGVEVDPHLVELAEHFGDPTPPTGLPIPD